MFRTLYIKLIMAMLLTSVLALAVVAIVTPHLIEQRFIEQSKATHYQVFQKAIESYIEQGFSLGERQQAEQFAAYMRQYMRVQHSVGGPPPHRRRPPPEMGQSRPIKPDPATTPGRFKPPFEFLVVDTAGYVLVPTKSHKPGDQVALSAFKSRDPLNVNGETLAYAITHEKPPLTERDKTYLEVLKQSLYSALAIALIVILMVGSYWGNRLSRALKQLTAAVKNMGSGKLEQQVHINANDEVGELANAFNRMNQELVETYQQLEHSHQTIEKQAQKLKELSIRDELTGLHNRRFFNEQFTLLHANAVRYHRPFAIVLGDIDRFKSINDNFSHLIGDEVLKQVAELIQQEVRDGDIVARYGGEEIAIILPETDIEDAFLITERIRQRIQEHQWAAIHPDLQITISFGQCTELIATDCMKMLDIADQHLYRAKESGRNKTVNEKVAETLD